MHFWSITTFLLWVGCLSPCVGSGWENKRAEIYFILDGSDSIWRYDFDKVKDFVKELVTDMDIRPTMTRVGVGVISEYFNEEIPLNNKYTKEDLISTITAIQKHRGDAFIYSGIEGFRKHLNASVTRDGVPRIAVLITSSVVRNSFRFYDYALAAKNDGIFVFTVGVGNYVREDHLTYMTSHPLKKFMYLVSDFSQLKNIKSDISANMAEVNLFLNDKGTCGEKHNVDTVFIYDERELGAALTDAVNDFLVGVFDELRINSGNIRVGVVSASPKTCHKPFDIKLGDYVRREDLKKAMDERRDDGRGLIYALQKVVTDFFKAEVGHRMDNAEKRIVLIMSSEVKVENQQTMLYAAYRARLYGINVYVVRHDKYNYNKTFLEDQRLVKSSNNVLYVDLMQDAVKPFLTMFCKDI